MHQHGGKMQPEGAERPQSIPIEALPGLPLRPASQLEVRVIASRAFSAEQVADPAVCGRYRLVEEHGPDGLGGTAVPVFVLYWRGPRRVTELAIAVEDTEDKAVAIYKALPGVRLRQRSVAECKRALLRGVQLANHKGLPIGSEFFELFGAGPGMVGRFSHQAPALDALDCEIRKLGEPVQQIGATAEESLNLPLFPSVAA
jgi:hypothetical protein